MKKFKTKIIKTNAIKSFVCDFCGKEEKANECDWWGGVDISITGGYGSTELDLERLNLDICDKCFKQAFGKFRHLTKAILL